MSFSYLEDGRELSSEMLKAGLARYFKKYNTDPKLVELEVEDRQVKCGLWKDENPMASWLNRKLHRQEVSTKDMFESTE